MKSLTNCLVASLLIAGVFTYRLCGQATEPRQQGPQITSPEYLPGQKVTFRLKAPHAKDVKLVSGPIAREVGWKAEPPNAQKIPLERTADGVWSVTLGPLGPDRYPYVFEADGVRLLDPQNMDIATGNNWPQTFANVPGDEARIYEQRDVPHGAVTVVPYFSKTLRVSRQVAVYTPPGYEVNTTTRYPVLYLLHGSGGYYRSWTDDGRVNYILDNLIAEGKAVPFVIVMPSGHVPAESATVPEDTPGGQFGADLVNDIIPLVESRFRIRAEREHRALAGLSMGGSQTYQIGFRRLDLFSSLAMLSGGIGGGGGNRGPQTFAERYPDLASDPKRLNGQLHLLWFGTGEMDGPERIHRVKAELDALGVNHIGHVSKFDHSFRTWRRDIAYEIAPRLFQTPRR